jgi:glycosyltransferase involved in cell wall biosynthesis
MTRRVLHLLSQRPDRTGSGITLDAMVAQAGQRGWEQRVLCGLPTGELPPAVGGLEQHEIEAVRFETSELPFAIPGMSDLMPYPSRRFSSLADDELELYRRAWRRSIAALVERFDPQVIHSHHLWLMTALASEHCAGRTLVGHCHGTDLRQRALCPELTPETNRGALACDRIVTLHANHAEQIRGSIGVREDALQVVGAGYHEEIFFDPGATSSSRRIVYAGKYSEAKGLPSLLEAFAQLHEQRPEWELHIAGDGEGAEAETIRARILELGHAVREHGQLQQPALAELFRSAAICVLPSFFEGLPLVLVEALACGCRIVATDLAGVREVLAPAFGDALHIVPMPALQTVDQPRPDALPKFVDELSSALNAAIQAGPIDVNDQRLRPFRWGAVFERIEPTWG